MSVKKDSLSGLQSRKDEKRGDVSMMHRIHAKKKYSYSRTKSLSLPDHEDMVF